jgi:prohibitin 2
MLTFLFILLSVLSLGLPAFVIYKMFKLTPETKDQFGRTTQHPHFNFTTGGLLKAIVSLTLPLFFFGLCLSNVQVDAGNRGILKHFGHVVGNLEPGLHFVRPIGSTVVEYPVQSRIVQPNEEAASKDLQIVYFQITFRYHIDPDFADYVYVQDNGDPESRIIGPAILEAVKSVTSQYDVQELVSKRPLVRDGIEAFVTTSLKGSHVIPEATAVTDFKFSKDYEAAIESKQVAQQKAEQATNDLQRIKVEAQQAQAEAVGLAEAKVANANGEAQSVLIVAKAKAEAQRLQKESITPELIQIRTLELLKDKWDGAFPETFFGSGGVNPANILISPQHHEKKADPQ